MEKIVCPECGSTSIATLRQNQHICMECGWRTPNINNYEAERTFLRYYEEFEGRADSQ